MGFKLPKKARSYFKFQDQKNSPLKILFDSYYLCLLVGLQTHTIGSKEDHETDDIIDYFPEGYKDKKNMIVGLLLVSEMKRKAIRTDHKSSVEKLMSELLSNNDTSLTAEGFDQLNLYAVKGMEIISEEIPQPEIFSEFLVAYGNWFNA